MSESPEEAQLDGLVGPTHNYAGLSPGNVASERHKGLVAHPKAAALQGIAKMRVVRSLGVTQGVLPPHERPQLGALRAWGFRGSDEQVIASAAAASNGLLLRIASSASPMWTANAATVVPSCDSDDGRLHLAVANLSSMPHRSLEPPATARVLRAIFGDEGAFAVHDALPGGPLMSDEGAANHTRLSTDRGAAHLFAWGRAGHLADADGPKVHPARQTREASLALSRVLGVAPGRALFPRQHPAGIDAGSFHTDVLAVGTGDVLLMHELAFADAPALMAELRALLGPSLKVAVATEAELPVASAVRCYPFNSQLLSLPSGKKCLVSPSECRDDVGCMRFSARLVDEGVIDEVRHVEVRQSMQNGGGPACLRLRVPMTSAERARLTAGVICDDALLAALEAWVSKHYRDDLAPDDLADPSLHREQMTALDELTRLLGLGNIYDFQRI